MLCAVAAVAACDPFYGEIDSPRFYRIVAERVAADGSISVMEDVNGRLRCDRYAVPPCAPAGEADAGGSEAEPWSTPAPTAGPPVFCECVGSYRLESSLGLRLTFLDQAATGKGHRTEAGGGALSARWHERTGNGWVLVSKSDLLALRGDHGKYFLDLAGGFELSFAGFRLRRGLFYSLPVGTDE